MINPKVSIIIINWNGYADTVECLESLKDIDYTNYHIILVDNGSLNNEAMRLKKKFPFIKVILNKKNEGFCKANNQGIKSALKSRSEYIMLLNNDTVVKREFLKALITYYASKKNIGAISPLIKYYNSARVWYGGGVFYWWLGMFGHRYKGKKYLKYTRLIPYKTDYISGCCLLTRASILKDVGYLDERYFAYYEDADWSFRARRKGYELIVFPNVVISHKKSASAGIKGKNLLTSTQAVLISRNSYYFAKNLNGLKKVAYIFGLYFIKYPFDIFHCDTINTALSYLLRRKL